MPSSFPVVIIQKNAPSSSSSSVNSYSTSPSSSVKSGKTGTMTPTTTTDSIVTTAGPPPPTTPFPQVPEVLGDGRVLIRTGQRMGGNPHGGPKQTKDGYYRVETRQVTIHNTGGVSTGRVPKNLGRDYANGPEHTEECRDKSQWSDNQGLCFCPVGTFK